MTPIIVGSRVSWTTSSKRGRVISARKFCGTVQAVDGDTASVRTDSGRTKQLPISSLTHQDDDGPYSIFAAVARHL